MKEVIVNYSSIQPEVPKVLENEQINVYVPNASTDYPGVASFEDEHFDVDARGKVTIEGRILSDVEYSRKTIDDFSDNSAVVKDGDTFKNIKLETNSKNLIGAANELKRRVDVNDHKIGSGEIVVPDNLKAGESGLIGLANANNRKLDSFIEDAERQHQEFRDHFEINDAKLQNHENRFTSHENRIRDSENEIINVKSEIGDEQLNTSSKTLKGSVNETFALSKSVENVAILNRNNLANLTALALGTSRSYVVRTFTDFINFIKGKQFIELLEDRDSDGIAEVYRISTRDLRTGDNILIVEHSVPDFWFELNADDSKSEDYEYDNVLYNLTVYDTSGRVLGSMHVSEFDYNVIGDFATSASVSAANAKSSELKTLGYKNEVEDLVTSIYVKQIAPPLSLLSTAIVLTTPNLSQLL